MMHSLEGTPAGSSTTREGTRYSLVLAFVLLAAGIVTVGAGYFRYDARRYRAGVADNLLAVAEMKTSELARWRADRLGDASLFLSNAPFSTLLRRLSDDPRDEEAESQLRAWLTRLQTHLAYDKVALLDVRGAEWLAVAEEQSPVPSLIATRVPDVLRSKSVAFEDFYRNEYDERVYLSVLVPILDDRSQALGIVALRIDPETYLYPLLNRWPSPSRTAETLLVRRDGNDAMFLNELKFQKRSALRLRRPLTSPKSPAARVVLGQRGIMEGTDYQGVPVIAALRAVPDSPWFLVVRMDVAEVNGPLRERLWVTVLLVGGMLAAAAAGIGIIWREQRVRELRDLYESERERAWLHDVIARSLNEVYVFDPETLRIVFVNHGTCRNLGYTREEFAGLTALHIEPELGAENFRAMLEPLRSAERPTHEYETVHRRKDGSEYPVKAHLQLVDSGASAVFLCIVNDITERRRAEEALKLFRTLVDQSTDSIEVIDPDSGEFLDVNERSCQDLGYSRDELLAMTAFDIDPALDQASFARSRDLLQQSGREFWEGIHRRKDGSTFPVEVNVTLVQLDRAYLVAVARDVTERRKAEVALRASEERYRAVAQSANEAIVTADGAGNIVGWNRGAESIFGYAEAEIIGQPLTLLIPERYHEDHLSGMHRVGSGGEHRVIGKTVELTGLRMDRSEFPMELSLARCETAEGGFVTGMFRDITTRKRDEETLRESQRVARLGSYRLDLVAGTWESSVILDEIFGIVDPAFRRDVSGWLSIVHPDQREEMATYFIEEVVGKAMAFDREYRIVRHDDRRERWVHGLGKLVADSEGRLVEMIGTIQDVTERRQVEEAILAEKAFSEAMLDSLPGIFCLFDNTGRFMRWNHSFETVSGYSAEEITAMRPLDLFDGEDRTLIEETIGRVFEAGAADAETQLLSKGGTRTFYYFMGVRIVVDGVPCCIGTGVDITTRKQLEAQLRQSQKLEGIGQLAGGVAHDFNNMLAVITMSGELALRQLAQEHPVRARVDEIMKAAERATSLTRQLLAFSRKQVMQPKLLDLNEIVIGSYKMLGRLLGEDIEIAFLPTPDLGTVKADPGQVEQVILNLAVNARDAMPNGGRLTIETANVELDEDYAATHRPAAPGRYVMLAVSDTGAGMDQETRQRIFEPFFTTKPEGKGTGLGLPTVYGIVKQSGGTIWVTSEPGQGTTFKVYLPHVDEPAEATRAVGPAATTLRGHETILLVEDNRALRKVVREMCKRGGYTVLMASDGEEALALARDREGPIDLLLTDVVMPRMGGAELANLLSDMRPGIRVVHMSGYTEDAIARQGVLTKGAVLLEKPFTGEKLLRVLREALDRPLTG